MSATLLPSPCKRTTGRPSPPPRRPLHALCKECDGRKPANNNHHSGFNPRTPCGVRPSDSSVQRTRLMFQSTHSLRSATFRFFCPAHPVNVSIHALLAECDVFRPPLLPHTRCFNPRTPCGVRLFFLLGAFLPLMFQSTHSLRSATISRRWKTPGTPVSIHALLAECDLSLVPRWDR